MKPKVISLKKAAAPQPPDDWDLRTAIERLTAEVQAVNKALLQLVRILKSGGD